jgi:hypothetical protein
MAKGMKINWPTGDRLIDEFKEKYGEKIILAFSRGKDSIAAALAMRGKLDIIPVHYDSPPFLDFITESLKYYEKELFDRHIIRLPHPVGMNNLSMEFFLQTLGNAEVITSARMDILDHEIMRDRIIEQEKLPKDIWSAVGVRATDSPMRRMVMEKHGPIRPKTKTIFPVWDWNKARLVEEISRSGISLPIDYLIWGRSFDGLDARFVIPMKKWLPNDFAKLKSFFPLIDVDIIRYELHTGEDVGGGFAKKVGKETPATRGRRRPAAVG